MEDFIVKIFAGSIYLLVSVAVRYFDASPLFSKEMVKQISFEVTGCV